MTSKILIIIAVLLVLSGVFYLLVNRTPSYAPTSYEAPKIQTASDLNTFETQLNSEDLNALDSQLNKLDKDSSGF